jgi:hypothetical protein
MSSGDFPYDVPGCSFRDLKNSDWGFIDVKVVKRLDAWKGNVASSRGG